MNKMKRGYPISVWLITLAVGSILAFINSELNSAGILFLIVLASIFFSLPAFLLNIVICRIIANSHLKTTQAQAIIAFIGVGLIGVTCGLIILSDGSNDVVSLTKKMFAGCSVSSVIAAFCFRLREPKDALPAGTLDEEVVQA